MSKINLNGLNIPTDNSRCKELQDNSISVSNPHFDNIEVILKDIEPRLLEIIEDYEDGAIFGCIAWLTSIPILEALAKCKNVQIIVQKEDFLRPDLNQKGKGIWRSNLQTHYNALRCKMNRYQFREPMRGLSYCSDSTVDPIRCVGNYNSDRKPAFPRSHHKFLVFCKFDEEGKYIPKALWTGSFNLTKNATNSFENVLFLTDTKGDNSIIEAYLNEHHQIFALSEKLNWEHDWSVPEFRIGS